MFHVQCDRYVPLQKVESFLNKDVTFVVSGSWDNVQGWQSVQEGEGPKKVAVDSSPVSSRHRQAQGGCSGTSQHTATPRPQVSFFLSAISVTVVFTWNLILERFITADQSFICCIWSHRSCS